jgi:hypothetical protein
MVVIDVEVVGENVIRSFIVEGWLNFSKISHIIGTFLQPSPKLDSITLKMEAVCYSETSEPTSTTRRRNLKEDS